MTQYKKKDEKDYLIQPQTEVQAAASTTPTVQQKTTQPTTTAATVVPNSQKANTTIKEVSSANKFSYNPSKPVYASPYSAKIDQLFNEIMATPDFSYDPNKDETYLALKDQHTNLGQRAMKDTTAQIAAQTGGIASSYAASAGAQAYQNYMNDLPGYIPELKQLAYEMYENERNKKYKDLGMLQDMENDEYNKYLNDLNEYYTDRDIAYNQFLNEQKQDNYLNELLYQREQDALNRQDYLDDKAYGRAQDEREKQRYENEFEYQKYLDSLKQQNYENEFDYQKYLNELEQQNYENNYNFNREQFEYEKEQNELDRIWDEAITRAQLGDYSGVNKLGIDMSNYGIAEDDEDFDPYSAETIAAYANEFRHSAEIPENGATREELLVFEDQVQRAREALSRDEIDVRQFNLIVEELYRTRENEGRIY